MHFNRTMLHLIMTLLVHRAYTESTKCPEACSCLETVVGSSYRAVSLTELDEAITQEADPEQPRDEYSGYLSGVEAIDGLYRLKVFGGNSSRKFPVRKRCGGQGEAVGDVVSRNFSLGSVKASDSGDPKSGRRKRTSNLREKAEVYETGEAAGDGEDRSAATEKPTAREGSRKSGFSYEISCVGVGDVESGWIQRLPGPATEFNIQNANFQSFKAFQEILKESSSELSQLTVLSVSDSIINQDADKSYSVKTESTNKREMFEKGRRSEFLPFASLQNPKPRSKSEAKFSSEGKSKNLQVLNLTNSTIVYLPQHMFHPFVNLRVLNLSNNLIEFIENETFGSLENLIHLDIRNNRLRSLNEIMFKNLTKLIFLDVSHNLLSSIEPTTFQYLLSLNVLSLASNPLSEKQEAVVLLGTGKRLQIVDISKTGLKQIPGTLERSVRILNLMGNFLLSIRCGDLDSYSLLSYLNLKSNRISYVEDDALGRLEFLKNLQISENNLFQIPKILPNKLEILNLSFNNIQNITSSDFLNLSSLKELSLSYNQVSSIERNVFDGLVHLRLLDLSRNPILVLPTISARIKLVVLNLSYFTNIPEGHGVRYARFPVQSPQSIKHLNLESSPVLTKTFLQDTDTLESFANLQELNLRFTNLTTIRKDIFSLLPKLSVLKVEGNPWHCSREILMLSTWLRSHASGESAEDEDEVNTAHCSTPPRLYKTNLIALGEKDFEGEESERKDKLGGGKGGSQMSRRPVDFSEPTTTTTKRVNVKVDVKTGANVTVMLNEDKRGPGDRGNCCGSSEEKQPSSEKDPTSGDASSAERVGGWGGHDDLRDSGPCECRPEEWGGDLNLIGRRSRRQRCEVTAGIWRDSATATPRPKLMKDLFFPSLGGVSPREAVLEDGLPEEREEAERKWSSDSRTGTSSTGEGFPGWSSTSTESPIRIKNSVDLKSRQVSLLALKKAEAVTSKDTASLKKESNSHLSFLILSSVGLVVVATLTFISLYFTRARRDQSYQRQNQDIEVCSISSLRNELW